LAAAGAPPAKFKLVAVNNMPHSGKPEELVDAFGISARDIVEAIKTVL
jgi:transketolase